MLMDDDNRFESSNKKDCTYVCILIIVTEIQLPRCILRSLSFTETILCHNLYLTQRGRRRRGAIWLLHERNAIYVEYVIYAISYFKHDCDRNVTLT